MKFKLTGKFGELAEVRNFKPHNGIDLAMPEGTPLRSIGDGIVEAIRNYGDANIGKGVIIRFEDGTAAIYGHMSKINVAEGQHITQGDLIGLSGQTGHAHGAHLHFGLQDQTGHFIDPTPLADKIDAMSGNEVAAAASDPGLWEKVKGFLSDPGGTVMQNGQDHGGLLWRWIGNELHDAFVWLGHWFVANLPDIMGYTTIGAGIFIILGAMLGKGGMMKPLGIYAGLLILALCILGGA